MSEHDPGAGPDTGRDDPVADEPAVSIHYPERAREALTAVIGHEPTLRLVDFAATTLAAFEGSQAEAGEAYLEALELAARTGMSTDEREIEAVVEQNEPLPRPATGRVEAAAVLHHTLRLAADETGQRKLAREA